MVRLAEAAARELVPGTVALRVIVNRATTASTIPLGRHATTASTIPLDHHQEITDSTIPLDHQEIILFAVQWID